MNVHPTVWLPPVFDTSPYDLDDEADRESCLDEMYQVFCAAFVRSRPVILARPVTHYKVPGCGDGRGEAFWHLTSRKVEGRGSRRTRDWDRARRIPWPRPVIEAVASRTDVHVWTKSGPRQERKLKVAVDDFSYVVIMEDRPSEAILVSGFPVPYANYRNNLRSEWMAGRIALPPRGAPSS